MTPKKFFTILGGLVVLTILLNVAVSYVGWITTGVFDGGRAKPGYQAPYDGDLSTCVPERIVRTPLAPRQQQVVCEDGRKFVIPMEPY